MLYFKSRELHSPAADHESSPTYKFLGRMVHLPTYRPGGLIASSSPGLG